MPTQKGTEIETFSKLASIRVGYQFIHSGTTSYIMWNCLTSATSTASCPYNCSDEKEKVFWLLWQQYQDHLYRCCLKWMNGNRTEAEDALSRAKLKAWEKMQKLAQKIVNLKAWLTRLTNNFCIDIYWERVRGAHRVENIEAIVSGEEIGGIFQSDSFLCALEKNAKKSVISCAINQLPARLRETFMLHFDRELSDPEIAQH